MTITYDEMNDLLDEAITNIKSLGYKVGKITGLGVSTRYSRAWAKCYRSNTSRSFSITVSSKLFNANKESVRDTIYHEVIHTITGCFNHGINFKNVAGHCNKKFKTNIETCCTEVAMMYGKKSEQAKNYTEYLMSLKK